MVQLKNKKVQIRGEFTNADGTSGKLEPGTSRLEAGNLAPSAKIGLFMPAAPAKIRTMSKTD